MTEQMVMIGCGNMGQAMLARWLEVDALRKMHLTVVKPTPLPESLHHTHVSWVASLDELPQPYAPWIVWLAVKPQKMAEIVPVLPRYFPAETLYCSLAAGIEIAQYQQWLGEDASVIRIMPNTPVKLGAGVVSMVASSKVTILQMQQMHDLLAPLGLIAPLPHEGLMDAATAVAGSGTAYVYLLIEALAEAGILHGLDASLARDMAAHTFLGAAQMALYEHTSSLAQLCDAVTSKGGTTEAALQQLEKNNTVRKIIQEAVSAAIMRAKALK